MVIREVDVDLAEYEVDEAATEVTRERIRKARRGWLAEDPEKVAARYRSGEIDVLDAVRQYGVPAGLGYWKTATDIDCSVSRNDAA